MPTYLLTWNPDRWAWKDLPEQVVEVALGRAIERRWSTGTTRKIQPGDRIYLMRLGSPPRGIVGSGAVTSPPFQEPHWDPERRAAGDVANYTRVRFERLVRETAVLPVAVLEQGPLAAMHWFPKASGVEIPPDLVPLLDALWDSHVPARATEALPDELTPGARYVEGAVQSALVNRYERDPAARAACIEKHGVRCVVCAFSFADAYGELGDGYIHVHHLEPLSSARGARSVDPERDLRPVCANCHAMLHRREPPLGIDELVQRLRMEPGSS